MTELFTDKVAFVTGGAAGMGLAAVKAFAEAGAAVAVVDSNEGAVRSVVEDLVRSSPEIHRVHLRKPLLGVFLGDSPTSRAGQGNTSGLFAGPVPPTAGGLPTIS